MGSDGMAAVAGLLHKVAPVKFASTDLHWIETLKRLFDAMDIHLALILPRSLNNEKKPLQSRLAMAQRIEG